MVRIRFVNISNRISSNREAVPNLQEEFEFEFDSLRVQIKKQF
jgi:hypothetical protein